MEYCRRYQKTVTVISDCSTGELVSPEGTQDEKTQDTGPESGGAHQGDDFSEPRLLHRPRHRKAPILLT